jgi:hypothetical protein
MNHKLKYYCRGLGTGILVTALLLLSKPSNGQVSLSNEEIIARAEALGMMKIDSLTDLPQPSETEEPSESETDSPAETLPVTETSEAEATDRETESSNTDTPGTEPVASETAASETPTSNTATSENTSQSTSEDNTTSTSDQPITPTDSEQPPSATSTTDGQTASITIYRGNGSLTVSKALEQAGLIEDAQTYDRYLCAEGYDNALRVGVYHIPFGSTYEQIAKIITGKTT